MENKYNRTIRKEDLDIGMEYTIKAMNCVNIGKENRYHYHRQRNRAAKVKNDVGTMYYYFFFLVLDQGTSYRRSCCRNFEKGSFD